MEKGVRVRGPPPQDFVKMNIHDRKINMPPSRIENLTFVENAAWICKKNLLYSTGLKKAS